jgi:hypothetical protein
VRTLRRLSRDELSTTFQQLIGRAPPRDVLPEDPRAHVGPLEGAGSLFVATEVEKLRTVIDELGRSSAPDLLAASGCKLSGDAQVGCLSTWARQLASLAFRRPLTPEEGARLDKLFEGGGRSEDDLLAIRALVGAVFMAPSFLYRTELGEGDTGRLTARELGARLAYLATLGPPDAELTMAADKGLLRDPAERQRQLERLLRSTAGRRALSILVLEWLGANESHVAQKTPKVLSGLGSDAETALRASAEKAIGAALDTGAEPTLAALFGTTAYLQDAAFAKVKAGGPSGTGDTAETQRAGLLMHPLVIAAHSKDEGSSPFQFGAFIREALLCDTIPAAPPDAAEAATMTVVPAGLTMREDLEARTSGPTCKGCHAVFAPLGFAFLPFDPVGRWMRQDPSGKPWDLAGEVPSHAGPPLKFQSPSDLSRALASHPQVQDCFASVVYRWAFGRAPGAPDARFVASLQEVARRTQGRLPAILDALVASPEFLLVPSGGE